VKPAPTTCVVSPAATRKIAFERAGVGVGVRRGREGESSPGLATGGPSRVKRPFDQASSVFTSTEGACPSARVRIAALSSLPAVTLLRKATVPRRRGPGYALERRSR